MATAPFVDFEADRLKDNEGNRDAPCIQKKDKINRYYQGTFIFIQSI